MVDRAGLNAAYEESKAAAVSMQLGIEGGELAAWLRENLNRIVDTHAAHYGAGSETARLAIATELVAIGVVAGRNEAARN